jgi:hypothetical protein
MRVSTALISNISHGNSGVVRACTMNGAAQAALKGRIKDLSEIIASLEQTIDEAKAAERDERFWGRAIAVAELTVAACDLFMEIVSTATPVGKAIQAIYGQKQTAAELSVGKFDPAKASTRALKGAAAFMPKGGAVITKLAAGIADTTIDGVRGQLSVKKVVLGSIDKNLSVLEYAFEQEGKAKAAAVAKHGKMIVKAGFKVFEAFDKPKTRSGAVQTLIAQSNAFKRRLQQLNEQLVGCDELRLP